MQLFYWRYPVLADLSAQLTRGHYVDLACIAHNLERSFYENIRPASTGPFANSSGRRTAPLLILAGSQDKEGLLKLARQGHIVEQAADIVHKF